MHFGVMTGVRMTRARATRPLGSGTSGRQVSNITRSFLTTVRRGPRNGPGLTGTRRRTAGRRR
jgi:hypothetical protein